MMISKFHKLIQSRLVWIIFFIVIVFSFVIWAMPWPARNEISNEARNAGKLFEEEISFDQFRQARANTYLAVAMMMGEPPRITDRMEKELTSSAWRRMANLKQAEKMGITAGNNEVVNAIKSQQLFADSNGQFSRQRYQNFAYAFLRNLGMTEHHFEEYVREEIIMQKLRAMVAQSLIISPFEIQRTFDTINDQFDVEYVEITPEVAERDIAITDEDIQRFFEANTEAFMIPPKISVRYVAFPISDFTNQVVITEDDALAYYNENIDDYTTYEAKKMTNEEKEQDPVESLSADLDEGGESIIAPFDEVSEQITALLTYERAKNLAAEKATTFAMTLSPDREGNAPTFDEASEKFECTIATTPPFSLDEAIDGIDAGLDFNSDAFDLLPNSDDYFSNAILGDEYVYVIALDQSYPERIPEFDEVADQVREACRLQAVEDASLALAKKVQETAASELEEGKTFAEVAAAFELPVLTASDFNAISGIEGNEDSDTIVPSVLSCNRGEMADPSATEDGRLLVIHVINRTPGANTALSTISPQIVDALKRERR
ncbi:MAG: SurA N-terminal domain-containing protein, partial [Kiritimatiellae bacterium]|nr:SurA N-terminal domain-containing protein [Kiritimatiellia bacterium]